MDIGLRGEEHRGGGLVVSGTLRRRMWRKRT